MLSTIQNHQRVRGNGDSLRARADDRALAVFRRCEPLSKPLLMAGSGEYQLPQGQIRMGQKGSRSEPRLNQKICFNTQANPRLGRTLASTSNVQGMVDWDGIV